MSGLTDRITEVLREHTPTTRREHRRDVLLHKPACKGCDWIGEGFTAHAAHVAERIEAELLKANYVAAVQTAVVNAMNAVGVALVGSSFELIERSPIPDEQIAEFRGGCLV